MAHLLHWEQPLQVGTAAHGATVHLGHAKARAVGRDDDVSGTADANATAQDETVHGDDHRHLVAMHGLEGVVVALVDRDDQVAVSSQLLDIDPGAEATAFGADDDGPDLRVLAQRLQGAGDVGSPGC